MKTVLILGAGVTRASRPKAALINRPPLDADFFLIAKSVHTSRARNVLDCLRNLVGDYAETLSRSLEIATTYLYIKAIDSKTDSPYHRGLLDLLTLLNEVLARTTNSIPVGPRSLVYRFLLSELNRAETPNNLTIITFNYDLLLERILESISLHNREGTFEFPGCYRLEDVARTPPVRGAAQFETEHFKHDGVALLKLHGSMNWQSNHTSNTPTPSALMNPNRALHVLDAPMIPTTLSWKRNKRRAYMKPIIVPPICGKRGMIHKRIIPLWTKAALALREADRIIIAGYSCPPLDLESRILISENLRANDSKRVYVIDPDVRSASKFVELCGVDHITIYESISDWVRDAKKYTQSNQSS